MPRFAAVGLVALALLAGVGCGASPARRAVRDTRRQDEALCGQMRGAGWREACARVLGQPLTPELLDAVACMSPNVDAPVREAACTRMRRPRPRAIDATPRPRRLATPLPDGEVAAHFWIDTGGDQAGPMQAGLGVTVQVGGSEWVQQLASCDEAGHGSAITRPGAVDGADCDGRSYDLYVLAGAVVVRSEGHDVTRIRVR